MSRVEIVFNESYNVLEYKYMKMSKVDIKDMVYYTNTDDKLKMIKEFTEEGIIDYIIDIQEKFKIQNTIKKTTYFGYYFKSLEKWFKENDPKKVFYISSYSSPSFKMFGSFSEYGITSYLLDKEIIDNIFESLLLGLNNYENNYFIKNDKKQIKITRLKDLMLEYGYNENINLFEDFSWGNCRDLDDKTLDYCLKVYEEMDNKKKIAYTELNEKLYQYQTEIKLRADIIKNNILV